MVKSEAKVSETQEKAKHLSATAWETPFSSEFKTAMTETIEPEEACLTSGVLIDDSGLGLNVSGEPIIPNFFIDDLF